MFKRLFNLWIACPLLLLSSYLSANLTQIPEEFSVTERWISWTTTFDIYTKTQVIGTVHRKFLALTPEYHLMDTQENLLAKARMRFFSFMAVFDVDDNQNNSIGTVQQQFAFFFPTFKILAPNGRILGEAVFNFWRTIYTVTDPVDGHTIATLSRPFFRLKNNWTIKILDTNAISNNNIHPHLFMTLIAFQVDKEYWEAAMRRRQQQQYDSFDSWGQKAVMQDQKNADNDDEADLVESYKSVLESFRADLEDVEPTEADFQVIEEMTEKFDHPSDKKEAMDLLNDQMNELFSLLSSDKLTVSQKSALFLMLDHKLQKS